MLLDNVNTYTVATYDAPKAAGKIVDKFIVRRPGQMWTKHKVRADALVISELQIY